MVVVVVVVADEAGVGDDVTVIGESKILSCFLSFRLDFSSLTMRTIEGLFE